jgi:3D (Asp-Asp-Asp) domain-containing protein
MIDTSKFEGHTKGPWQIVGTETVCTGYGARWSIAEITYSGVPEEEDAVNLRLIAAAPDLLREVDRLYDVLEEIASLPLSQHMAAAVAQKALMREGA